MKINCQYCNRAFTDGAFSHMFNCNSQNNPWRIAVKNMQESFTKNLEKTLLRATNIEMINKYLEVDEE